MWTTGVPWVLTHCHISSYHSISLKKATAWRYHVRLEDGEEGDQDKLMKVWAVLLTTNRDGLWKRYCRSHLSSIERHVYIFVCIYIHTIYIYIHSYIHTCSGFDTYIGGAIFCCLGDCFDILEIYSTKDWHGSPTFRIMHTGCQDVMQISESSSSCERQIKVLSCLILQTWIYHHQKWSEKSGIGI